MWSVTWWRQRKHRGFWSWEIFLQRCCYMRLRFWIFTLWVAFAKYVKPGTLWHLPRSCGSGRTIRGKHRAKYYSVQRSSSFLQVCSIRRQRGYFWLPSADWILATDSWSSRIWEERTWVLWLFASLCALTRQRAISFDGSIWVAGGDVWGLETPSVCTFERIAPSNFSVTKMPPMLHRRARMFILCL